MFFFPNPMRTPCVSDSHTRIRMDTTDEVVLTEEQSYTHAQQMVRLQQQVAAANASLRYLSIAVFFFAMMALAAIILSLIAKLPIKLNGDVTGPFDSNTLTSVNPSSNFSCTAGSEITECSYVDGPGRCRNPTCTSFAGLFGPVNSTTLNGTYPDIGLIPIGPGGICGNAGTTCTLTFDQYGRITNATNATGINTSRIYEAEDIGSLNAEVLCQDGVSFHVLTTTASCRYTRLLNTVTYSCFIPPVTFDTAVICGVAQSGLAAYLDIPLARGTQFPLPGSSICPVYQSTQNGGKWLEYACFGDTPAQSHPSGGPGVTFNNILAGGGSPFLPGTTYVIPTYVTFTYAINPAGP